MSTSATTAAGKRRAKARAPKARPTPRGTARPAARRPRSASPKGRALRPLSSLAAVLPRRPLRWMIVVAALGAALAIAYFSWFRDSSLVAVEHVEVEGVASSDKQKIVAELTHAARQMTTLHVKTDRLTAAVRDSASVASLTADPSFPHGLTIHVIQRQPALVAHHGDQQEPVATDGSVLPGIEVPKSLPQLEVASLPASGRLSGEALAEALTIGAAPAPLRPLIDGTTRSSEFGITVTMHGGIELKFGTASDLEAKWAAVAAILADPSVGSLTYVDVRAPQRPAVGGTSAPSAATIPVTPTTTAPAAPTAVP